MAINQNHLFEDLNGVKCAIVEKNVAAARVDFLRRLLEHNGFTVVVVPSPPPKTAPVGQPKAAQDANSTPAVPPKAAPAESSAANSTPAESPAADSVPAEATAPPPETFTVGVTDVMFNQINAIFGRLLKTPDGHTVTLAYWQQHEDQSDDETPYFSGPA